MTQNVAGKKILIIAGGTGGHIFPALAVADILAEQGAQVSWLGSDVGLEKALVPARFPLNIIAARRLRGKSWCVRLAAPWSLLRSTGQAWRAIRRLKPDAVLAMGGFVSGPGGVAAKLAGVPLIVHEQNAVAGCTNRILAKFANAVATAYPGAFALATGAKVVGNPVRAEITAITAPSLRLAGRHGPLRILVLGGSQGAHALNQLMTAVATEFPQPQQLEIWHQTGKHDYPAVQARYAQMAAVTAKVQPFIDDMAAAYAWADVLVGRAGALTVAEIAAAGLASILVPFPAAVDDHQWYNGRYLEQAGAARLIREADISSSQLIVLIGNFLCERTLILTMAQKARNLAQPHAAEDVAALVISQVSE